MDTLLLETIRVSNGIFHNLELHRSRMLASCRELYSLPAPSLNLTAKDIPSQLSDLTLKCRVAYSRHIHSIEFEPYTPRTVRTLKMIHADSIDYHLKYADRTLLGNLQALKGDADEVMIIKDGLITDTSYSNLLFITPRGWLTPAAPLLNGVMRTHLLQSRLLKEAEITPEMLKPGNQLGITAVMLINAMMPPGLLPPVPLHCIS